MTTKSDSKATASGGGATAATAADFDDDDDGEDEEEDLLLLLLFSVRRIKNILEYILLELLCFGLLVFVFYFD